MSEACSPPAPEPALVARWNPARAVWESHPKNPACGHWACYSQTWPTSGMTRTGRAYAPLPSVPRTAENGCSSPRGPHDLPGGPLLKTPTANLGVIGGSQHPDKRKAGGHGPNLADEVEHLLPTPTASDGAKGSPNQKHGNGSPTLASTAATLTATNLAAGFIPDQAGTHEDLLPTPTASDGLGGPGTTPKRKGGLNLRTAVTHLPTGGTPTGPPSTDGNG